jgi:hypothetical protein
MCGAEPARPDIGEENAGLQAIGIFPANRSQDYRARIRSDYIYGIDSSERAMSLTRAVTTGVSRIGSYQQREWC